MNIELEALREAIDEAGRALAEFEKARTAPAAPYDAMLRILKAQLGALKATQAALAELDARVAGFAEAVR
jgi:hypothetical protein